jgi:hypothetical protein
MQTTHTTRTAAGAYRVEITQERDGSPALVMVWTVEIRADSGEVEDSTQTLILTEWRWEGRDGLDYVEAADWDHPRVADPENEVDAYSAALDAYRADRATAQRVAA